MPFCPQHAASLTTSTKRKPLDVSVNRLPAGAKRCPRSVRVERRAKLRRRAPMQTPAALTLPVFGHDLQGFRLLWYSSGRHRIGIENGICLSTCFPAS
jgi:hypothetical protein